MSIEITSWLDVYFALQASALESRGFVELDAGSDDATRWPRTSGFDVIAISAVLEPFLSDLPPSFGSLAIARRWDAVLADLTRNALDAPRDEYVENQSFWRALPTICVYLHMEGAPLPPPEIWDGLQAVFTNVLRNVGGDSPFKTFNVKTWDGLYLEQYKLLRDTRGADELAPGPGMAGTKFKIPRTTNADVIALADYWSKKLAGVKEVFGHKGVLERWKKALVDVDAIARKGSPTAVYSKNNAFWRELKNTAVHIAVADDSPTKGELFLDSLAHSVKNLPENIASGAKQVATALGEAAGDVAHGVGKVANEAGKGLFSGFGGPLLIGAGLLGVFLISRNRASSEGTP